MGGSDSESFLMIRPTEEELAEHTSIVIRERGNSFQNEFVNPIRDSWWNFVSSSKDRIERAKRDWKDGRFPKVSGDEVEFVPLPE